MMKFARFVVVLVAVGLVRPAAAIPWTEIGDAGDLPATAQVPAGSGALTSIFGLIGPGFNDEFGDTFGIIYAVTADGFTHRELRDHVEDMRSRLLQVPDVSKIEILGAQDEEIFVEFSMQRLLVSRRFSVSSLYSER